MNLLIFIHSLSSGGAERVTVNLANFWADKGWKITIVTMMGGEQDFYTLHSGIHRMSLNLDVKSTNPLMGIINNFRRLYALRKLLKKEQPDVALAMMSTANILLALATMGTRITTVGSERIHPPKLALGRMWSWLRRMTYPHLDAVVAQTNESANWLRLKTTAHQVSVIPNPVIYPLNSHEPRVKPEQIIGEGDGNGKNILLAVGRLAQQKGFERLIFAFSELSPLFPNWSLTILGEGTCRKKLENMVVELDLEEKVYLPGAVGNIGEWYNIADIYVMTSLFEGFPNTLAEALAHGLPVVSVDCETGPRDIIRHEIDGLLVPQNNQKALVDALVKLMGDQSLRKHYAADAIEVIKRFSVEKVAGMWEKLFEDVSNEELYS